MTIQTITSWFTESGLIFSQLEANGTIQVNSNSVASIELPEPENIIIPSEKISFISSQITVKSAFGFYSTIIALDPTITWGGNSAVITRASGNVTFLLRQPQICISGNSIFENLYVYHPPTIYTDGRTVELDGNITLSIETTNKQLVALPYELSSQITVKYEKPLINLNELDLLRLLLPYLVIVMIMVVIVIIIQHSTPTHSETKIKCLNT
jgi:hypothetical protein